VKLSGVEAGKVKKISIKEDKVVVELSIYEDMKIYRNARFTIGSTSIIGSKFLQIDQGTPSAGIIPAGSTVKGEDTVPLDKSLAQALGSLQKLLDDVGGESGIGESLNATLSNIRETTARINDIVGDSGPHMENAMSRLDSVSEKLDSLLSKVDTLVTKINSGTGTIGALVSDEKVKDNVTETLSNFKEASASAKDVLGRINSFRTYWQYRNRYEPLAKASRGDIGVKIYPREGRYYYLGVSNFGNPSDMPKATDYERKNRIDAQLGWEYDAFDLYAGITRGSGGAGIKYRPFHANKDWDRIVLLAEAFDFARNRIVEGRRFDHTEYDIGAEVKLNRFVALGARVNDLRETKRVQYTANVTFEDKDIAYLLGLVSFSSAGMKGRSSSK